LKNHPGWGLAEAPLKNARRNSSNDGLYFCEGKITISHFYLSIHFYKYLKYPWDKRQRRVQIAPQAYLRRAAGVE
jgi:hypothetical protein